MFKTYGHGWFFTVTFSSGALTSCQDLWGTGDSLDLCHSSAGDVDGAWALLFQHLLYHTASETPGWTWRIKWRNYEAEEKKQPTYVVAVIN